MNELKFKAQETIFFYRAGGRLRQRVDLKIDHGEPFEGIVEIDSGEFGRETTEISYIPACEEPIAVWAPVIYPNIADGRPRPANATITISGGAAACGELQIGRHRPWTIFLMNDICADFTWTLPEEDTMEASGRVIDYRLDWLEKTAHLPEENREKFNFNQTDELMWYIQRRPPEKVKKLFDAIRAGHFQVSPSFNSMLTSLVHTEQAIRSLYYGRALEREYGIDISVDQQIETPTCTWGFASILANAGVRYFVRNWLSYYSPYNEDRDEYPLFRWEGPDGKSVVVASDKAACLKRNYAHGGMFIHETYDNIDRELHEWWLPNFEANGAYPYDALPMFGSHNDLHRDTSAEIATILANVSRYNGESWEYPRIINATWSQYIRHIEDWHGRNAFELPVLRGDYGTSWEEWPAGVAHILADMRGNVNRFLALEQLSAAAAAKKPGLAPTMREELGAGLLKMEQIAEHPWNGSVDWERVDSNRRRVMWNREMEANNARLRQKASEVLFGCAKFACGGTVAAYNALSWDSDRLLTIGASEPMEVYDVLTGLRQPSFFDQATGELRCLAKDVPALGYRLFCLKKPAREPAAPAVKSQCATIENEYYRVTVDGGNGSIGSIIEKMTGAELVNKRHLWGVNQFVYLSQRAEYTGGNVPAALVPGMLYTVKVKTSWNICTETPYGDKDSKRFLAELPGYGGNQKVTLVEYAEYTLGEVSIEQAEQPDLGRVMTVRARTQDTTVETRITLLDGVDGIDIENSVHKKATSEPQEVHFTFPFDVPGGKCHYDGPGALIRPEEVSAGGDHLNGSGRQMYAVQSFVDVSNEAGGVTLAQVDSSLVQFGRRTTREYPVGPGIPDNTVLALVMTNKQPEMRQNQAGNEHFTFRFSIASHRDGYDAVRSFRFGQRHNVPALCFPVHNSAIVASDAPVKRFVALDREDVSVSALKPAEFEDGSVILRIRDIAGRGGAVSMDVSGLTPRKAYSADLLERDLQEVKITNGILTCDILPNGYATFRLEC